MPTPDPAVTALERVRAAVPQDTRRALAHGLRREIAVAAAHPGTTDDDVVAARATGRRRLLELFDEDAAAAPGPVRAGVVMRVIPGVPLGPGAIVREILVAAASDTSAAEYVWLLAGVEQALVGAARADEARFLEALLERLRAVAWFDPAPTAR